MHSLALFVVIFIRKIYFKLLNITFRKILFRGSFWRKKSEIEIKNLLGYKIVKAVNQSVVKRRRK